MFVGISYIFVNSYLLVPVGDEPEKGVTDSRLSNGSNVSQSLTAGNKQLSNHANSVEEVEVVLGSAPALVVRKTFLLCIEIGQPHTLFTLKNEERERLTKEDLDPALVGVTLVDVTKDTHDESALTVADELLLLAVLEFRVASLLSLDAVHSSLASKGSRDDVGVTNLGQPGIEDGLVEGVVVAGKVVLARQRTVVLNSVVLDKSIKVEGEQILAQTHANSTAKEEVGKVLVDVEDIRENFLEHRQGDATTVMRQETMVSQRVERRARSASIAGASGLPLREVERLASREGSNCGDEARG